MPELSQLVEKHAEERMISFGDLRDRSCAHDKCYSMRLRRYLSPSSKARDPACCRYAAQKCDDFPPSHSITSSARARRVGGIVTPRALAVFRLTTNSNVVGCSIGKSAGLAPRATRSTISAARRYIPVKLAP